jgi:histidinol dehydrogenase
MLTMTIAPVEILRIDTRQHDVQAALVQLRKRLSVQGDVVTEAGRRRTLEVFGEPLTPQQVVERICRDVAEKGIWAVLDYTARIDKVQLDAQSVRVPQDDLRRAHQSARPELLAAVRRVRQNIWKFQEAILHRDVRVERPGGYLVQRYRPLRRAGICVPGGAAAYPSTLLMTVVPAQVAGVEQLAVVAPPTRFGAYNTDLLATCHELGVEEVYRLGGAQAVAALAYGVEGIDPVDKIVGPGNLFVALAKRYVFGVVGIDSIAGPSEVVVIIDESTRPEFTAADLLAQAEHAPGASILVSWSQQALDAALAETARQLMLLDRAEACRIANYLAPEHLHIATADAEQLAEKIRCAGAIFLGHYTPVALGDYAAGPSHVLPTSGTARWASALSSNDFLRADSVVCFWQDGLEMLADDVALLASVEGLSAHRHSVEIRRRQKP